MDLLEKLALTSFSQRKVHTTDVRHDADTA